MNIQLVVVGLCIAVAILFMARKIIRTLGSKPQCECSSCGKACQSCPDAPNKIKARTQNPR